MPVATANGKKFTFPEGTTPEQMGEAIDSYFSSQSEPAQTEQAPEQQSVLPAPVAEGVSALNRGVAAIPDFFIDAANAATGLVSDDIPKIPRVQDTLEQATDGAFGARNFMEPGLARTVVQEGGEFGGGLLPGAVAATPDLVRQGAKVTKEAIAEAAPTIETLKQTARGIYQQIDELGIQVNSRPVQKLSEDVAKLLKREGHNVRVTPKVQGVIDELAEISQGSPTITEIDTARKVARQAALSPEPAEQRLGKIAVDRIDDFINGLPEQELVGAGAERVGPLFTEARGLWSRARKGEVIEEAFRKADLQASGYENGLRIQFRQLLNNRKTASMFSAEEKEALKQVVKGGKAENFARLIGKFGLEQDQAVRAMLPGLGAFAGASVGGGTGALATPIIGTAAQRFATNLTQKNANLASALVRAGGDAKKVARAYLTSVPKANQSPQDLAMLLLGREISPSKIKVLEKSGNQLLRDVAFVVGLISSQAQNDFQNGEQDQQGQ